MIWVQPDKLLYDKMILTKMIVYYAILRHCDMILLLIICGLRKMRICCYGEPSGLWLYVVV